MEKLTPIEKRVINKTTCEYRLFDKWYRIKDLHEICVRDHDCKVNRYTFAARIGAYLREKDERFDTYEKCMQPPINYANRKVYKKANRPAEDEPFFKLNKTMPVGSLSGKVR